MTKLKNKAIGLVGSLLILLCECSGTHLEHKSYTNDDFLRQP